MTEPATAASLTFVGLVAIALAITACSADAGEEPDAAIGEEVDIEAVERILDEPPLYDPGPDVGGIGLQESILADYWVTFAEYERAVRAAVSCVEDEGFTAIGPARYPDGPHVVIAPGLDSSAFLTWAYTNVSDSDALEDTEGRCRAQWSDRVERVWEYQHRPSEQEIQAWLDRAWACAREQGLPLSDPPTEQEATRAVSAGCRPWEASA